MFFRSLDTSGQSPAEKGCRHNSTKEGLKAGAAMGLLSGLLAFGVLPSVAPAFRANVNVVGQTMMVVVPSLFTFVYRADTELNHCAQRTHRYH